MFLQLSNNTLEIRYKKWKNLLTLIVVILSEKLFLQINMNLKLVF